MPDIARGTRDARGHWHADNPEDYPPMDVHGQLPWSILDQSAAHWQARKRWWAERVADDPEIRAHSAGMISTGRHGAISGGVSMFDPFLAELLITWHTRPGHVVADPFAGGPVRGVVASMLDRRYLGADISPAQIESNRQAHAAGDDLHWEQADGVDWLDELVGVDYILTCPPYHNLERYSDDPSDLSAMTWGDYVSRIHDCMTSAHRALGRDRFMSWVVGDVRDSRGHLRRLPAMVADAASRAGFQLCNEQILVAPIGTRAKTMRRPWEACRTTSRRHQIVYTWAKGDRRAATWEVRHV